MMDGLVRYLRNRYWHPICHRKELLIPNDFFKFNWLGDDVAVFNDNGSLVAFDNRCPHGGARIYVDQSGNRSFLCPYHGWSYACGKLKVTNASSFENCSLIDIALQKLATDWCGDFLFVSRDPLLSLNEQLGDLFTIIEGISDSIEARHDFNSYAYQCDWRISLENALEPYHVPSVHSGSLGLLRLKEGKNELIGENSIWYTELRNERMIKQFDKMRRLFSLRFQYDRYMSIFLFPFSMISSTFGYSFSLQNFFPSHEPNMTHFNSRLLTGKAPVGVDPSMLGHFFKSSAEINRKIFEEDHDICRRVQLDSWLPEPPRYYSTSEDKLLHFRRSYVSAATAYER